MAEKRPHSELSGSNEEYMFYFSKLIEGSSNLFLRLLASGLFADVTVQCKARQWKLHRNILSIRCEFFRKALEPDKFKESAEMHVEIREQDPDRVYWIIYFIYTGRLPGGALTALEDKTLGMQSCIELFEIADFFTLSTLCTHARDALLEHMVKNAKHTQSLIKKFDANSKIDACVDKGFVDRFFQALKMVESFPLRSFDQLRDTFLMYPELTQYAVVRSTPFRKRLLEDPDFTNFALRVLGNAFRADVEPTGVAYLRCETCAKSTEIIVSVTQTPGRLKGYCRGCHPIGNVNVFQDLGGKAPAGPVKRRKTALKGSSTVGAPTN
ncbi:hypothetical protein EKO27_g10959 [Xylaria grammica]|uniref:BTB domain-containing protein n=1 Tax=Xylaria grammica TaxID=363999 RepID=A0A439CPR7_9PEZI|nr:hypothetical protein EKO27_g10959 [Xylaria grammica]